MNPLTNVKNITKLNETELASGSIHKKSWHDMYKDSAWIFIGGLQYDLTEGDILAVFSQYGEIVNVNLVRDKKTGKSKGFCFLCYSNQKSTVLAVDNFNGTKLCNRTIRVDHVANYKPPKEDERDDEITKKLKSEGCAPVVMQTSEAVGTQVPPKKKKSKKEKKEKKKKRKSYSDASDSEKATSIKIKVEREDPGYDKYDIPSSKSPHEIQSKQQERNLDDAKGGRFQIREKYHSENGKQFHRHLDISIKRENDDSNKNQYSQYKESRTHTSSSKSHKRRRSRSSSDEYTSSNRNDKIRHKNEGDQAKHRHSDGKQKYKETVHSSSSSSDSESSSLSTSGDEMDKDKSSRYSRKDKHSTSNNNMFKDKYKYSRKDDHRTSDNSRSYKDANRQKHNNRSDDLNRSNKSKHDKDIVKHSKHRSKTNYRSDDSDNREYKYSYNKRKHDKR